MCIHRMIQETAAKGALHFYEKDKDNNPVRIETAEEAIQQDDRISKVRRIAYKVNSTAIIQSEAGNL